MNPALKNSLKPGHIFEISDYIGDELISERMQEMGLRIGVQMKFIRQAPFGGPLLFQISTMLLALREEELACLKIKSI